MSNMSALGKYFYKQMMNGNTSTPEVKKERTQVFHVFDNTEKQRPLGEWVAEGICRRGTAGMQKGERYGRSNRISIHWTYYCRNNGTSVDNKGSLYKASL